MGPNLAQYAGRQRAVDGHYGAQFVSRDQAHGLRRADEKAFGIEERTAMAIRIPQSNAGRARARLYGRGFALLALENLAQAWARACRRQPAGG